MGFRFRKSFGAGPARINVSKSGVGGSIGIPGIRIGRGARGNMQLTISIPGTGIGWTFNLSPARKP